MSKLSPATRLNNAARRLSAANDACPHWDYESAANCCHECCDEVHAAETEYYIAKRAYELQESCYATFMTNTI